MARSPFNNGSRGLEGRPTRQLPRDPYAPVGVSAGNRGAGGMNTYGGGAAGGVNSGGAGGVNNGRPKPNAPRPVGRPPVREPAPAPSNKPKPVKRPPAGGVSPAAGRQGSLRSGLKSVLKNAMQYGMYSNISRQRVHGGQADYGMEPRAAALKPKGRKVGPVNKPKPRPVGAANKPKPVRPNGKPFKKPRSP